MLSTLSIVTLIASTSSQYKRVVDAISQYEFFASYALDGWNGIDSIPCVVLIHLAHKHMIRKDTYVPKMIDKKTMTLVYQAIWDVYTRACNESNLPFVPCIKGLTTILNNASLGKSKTSRTSTQVDNV